MICREAQSTLFFSVRLPIIVCQEKVLVEVKPTGDDDRPALFLLARSLFFFTNRFSCLLILTTFTFPIASLYCTRKLMDASIMVICANVCVRSLPQHRKRGNWERNRLKSVCLIGFIISREQRGKANCQGCCCCVHDHHHHHWWWCAGGGNWWTTSVLLLPLTLLSSPPDLHFALLPFLCTDYYFDYRCHIH